MIKLSKKQLSMSLFVLALNTLPSNSFASGQFSEETEGELGNSSSVVINTERKALNFENIFKERTNVGRNDIINIADVDILDANKKNYLNTILDGGNNLVNLIITRSSLFLNDGVLSIRKNDLPRNLKHLSIKDYGGLVTKTIDSFLYSCDNLTSFDSRGLENVKYIGSDFLSLCDKLTSIDLRGLVNVIQIGNYFLYCSNITSIDSRGLENVIQIGKWFLLDCKNLTSVNLLGLVNVEKIGDSFLNNCDKLTSFNLRGLVNVKQVGKWFLSSCKSKEIITTKSKASFWKKNFSEDSKKKIVFLIQNEDKYNDIEERVEYVRKDYEKEIGDFIFSDKKKKKTRIKTSNALFLLC